MGHADSSAGFRVTAFALASAKLAPLSRAPCPSFAAARTWRSALEGTRRRRVGSHRYSWILASPDDANDVENLAPRGSDGGDDDVSGDAGVIGDEATDGGGAASPSDARQEEQQLLTGKDDVNPSAPPEGVDWDAAWANTKRKMEEDRKRAPAFSGRKQVVATKNADGEYDFVEILADGSRKRRGNGGGGFEFTPDNPGGADASGRFRDRDREVVDLATTNQVRDARLLRRFSEFEVPTTGRCSVFDRCRGILSGLLSVLTARDAVITSN